MATAASPASFVDAAFAREELTSLRRLIPNPGDQFVGSGLGHQWKAVSREMVAG